MQKDEEQSPICHYEHKDTAVYVHISFEPALNTPQDNVSTNANAMFTLQKKNHAENKKKTPLKFTGFTCGHCYDRPVYGDSLAIGRSPLLVTSKSGRAGLSPSISRPEVRPFPHGGPSVSNSRLRRHRAVSAAATRGAFTTLLTRQRS